MDFANLFSQLSPTEGDARSPGPPAFTPRSWRGCKRRGGRQGFQSERSQPNKRQKNEHGHEQDYGYRNSEGPKRGQTNRGRGWRGNNFKNYQGQQNHQFKTTDGPKRGQKNHGRGQRGNNFHAPARPRFMTQGFKDQNALVVDGRIFCKHFIWGNCIKGDDCQMLHAPVHNDLIKEMCKFYVVGFCSRGDSCPYMHKSFPCKFFHRKGSCVNGDDCKFSHDPLTSVTEPLLDAAMRLEQEQRERPTIAEQKQKDVEPTVAEEKKPDVLNPAMPKFYNSLKPHVEVDEAKEPAKVAEDNNTMAQTGDSPAKASVPEEPVCYSVEAVLGPRHSFPALFSYSASHVPPSPPAAPPPTTKSVASVLRTYKSLCGSSVSKPPSSLDAKVCVSASPQATEVNSEFSPVAVRSKASFLKPALRDHRNMYDAPLPHKPDESFTPKAKVKTVVDVSRHMCPPQNQRSSPATMRPPLASDVPKQGSYGGFKNLFSSPPGQRAAPTEVKPPSSKRKADFLSSSQTVAQFKDCVTFLVRNLKNMESACHGDDDQPDSSQKSAKRKSECADEARREFQFKTLFSSSLPSASSQSQNPEPADDGDKDEVVPGVGSICALFTAPLSQTTASLTHPPKASPNSLHLRSAKETQQAPGTHTRREQGTSVAKQLPTQQDAGSHQQLAPNNRSQLKNLFLNLGPSSARP